MTRIVAEREDEGIRVTTEFNGTANDIGIEGIYIIAHLMHNLKDKSQVSWHAVLNVLANNPEILDGDWISDDERQVVRDESEYITIKKGVN